MNRIPLLLDCLLYCNKGIPASKPLFPAVVWQRVGIGRSTRLRQAQKGSKKLNSMLGRIRKPGSLCRQPRHHPLHRLLLGTLFTSMHLQRMRNFFLRSRGIPPPTNWDSDHEKNESVQWILHMMSRKRFRRPVRGLKKEMKH